MEWLKNQVIAALSGDQKVSKQLLIALAGVVAVASLVLVAVNRPEPPTGEFSVSADETVNEVSQQFLYVHVVGEVQSPGMYQLPIGARLVDAVFAAGGLTEEADNASVNLARELTDGEQIIVFSTSQEGQAAGTTASGLVSLNRAGDKELEELPGIGPALAGRIVAWREANGGFKSVQDLLKVSGIGESLLSGVIDLVTL
ncbi:MAG: ComEA family DNA-binding protein [Rhodoluna sp.]|nr:ComEA family DNA-binding protein [Rhodoluna sp.]